jgi:hypothetical protein
MVVWCASENVHQRPSLTESNIEVIDFAGFVHDDPVTL